MTESSFASLLFVVSIGLTVGLITSVWPGITATIAAYAFIKLFVISVNAVIRNIRNTKA